MACERQNGNRELGESQWEGGYVSIKEKCPNWDICFASCAIRSSRELSFQQAAIDFDMRLEISPCIYDCLAAGVV